MSAISKYYTLGMDELSEAVVIFKKCCNKINTHQLINSNATVKFDKLHSDFLNTANSLLVNYNSMQLDEIESMCKTLIIINAKIQKLLLIKKYINNNKDNKKIRKQVGNELQNVNYMLPSFKTAHDIFFDNHCFTLLSFIFSTIYCGYYIFALFFIILLILLIIGSLIKFKKETNLDRIYRNINSNKYFERMKMKKANKSLNSIAHLVMRLKG